MANSNYRKLRKTKIKQQLKEQRANRISKELAEQYNNMTDQQWEELGEKFAEYLAKSKEENEVSEKTNE